MSCRPGRTFRVALTVSCLAFSFAAAPSFANEGGGGGESDFAPPSSASSKPAPKRGNPQPGLFQLFKKKDPAPKAERRPRRQGERRVRKAPRRVVRRVETAPSGLPAEAEGRFLADQVIVRFQLSAAQAAMDRLVARLNLRHLEGRTFRLAGITAHRYEIAGGGDVREVITALEADASVVYAQPNYIYRTAQATSASPQYVLDRLHIGEVHKIATGNSVKVAVIDSPVDSSHPGFSGTDVTLLNASDVAEPKADDHGTGMAGAIAGRGTVNGLAPDVSLLAVAAFSPDENGVMLGNSWTIAKAMELAWKGDAKVFNMSFAGPPEPLVGDQVEGADERGIVMIAAVGNEGPQAKPLYPAAYEEVVGVTATDDQDAIFAHANQGDYVDFAVPGVNILTLKPQGKFGFASGTSVAAAHVSGIAALLLSRGGGYDGNALREVLSQSATDAGEKGRDPVFGAGIPDPVKAVSASGS